MKCTRSKAASLSQIGLHSRSFALSLHSSNQEFCWQWNILNLTTPRKTFWRIAFYFGWPNCNAPHGCSLCGISLTPETASFLHSNYSSSPGFISSFLHFSYLWCSLRGFGMRREEKKKVLLCFFFVRELLLKHLKSLVYGRSWSDRQGCPIYSQIKKNHTGREC